MVVLGAKTTTLLVKGMHCTSCAIVLTSAFKKTPGVLNANVDYSTSKAVIEFDSKITNETKLIDVVKSKGYTASVEGKK